jgi:hypothetical protein
MLQQRVRPLGQKPQQQVRVQQQQVREQEQELLLFYRKQRGQQQQ